METKSRYEVIAELEADKRRLILERADLDNVLFKKKQALKNLMRDVEDREEEIKQFEKSIETSKKTITELIATLDEGLKRFQTLQIKDKS